MVRGMQDYLQADLDRLEAPVYDTWLQRRINLEGETSRVDQLQAVRKAIADNKRPWLAARMLSDNGFYAYLQDNQGVIWAPEERHYWQEHRVPIQSQWISRLSANELGLVPAHIALSDLIAYQFLHGGWGHLLGNLLILFMLGFTVEKALGPGRYLLAYLLCGVLSGLIWAGFNTASTVPLVGASGAISGLMGMYLAIFGRQRIRFFYFLWVYFDYFRAPALILLPLWIAKQFYDHWFGGATGVAYLAHAGGLIAGAGIIWLLGKSWLQVNETFFEPEEDEQDDRFRNTYAQAMKQLSRLDFEQARLQFEALWKRHPERTIVLEHLYNIARLRPDQEIYRTRSRELMQTNLARHQPERMLTVWQEYLSSGQPHHPLSPEDHNRVFFASLKTGELKLAEKVFERLRGSGDELLTLEASRLLAQEFDKRQMGQVGS